MYTVTVQVSVSGIEADTGREAIAWVQGEIKKALDDGNYLGSSVRFYSEDAQDEA